MPRPAPLNRDRFSTATPNTNYILTPRTPHSRAGRAEEAYTEVDLDNDHDDGTDRLQAPLLGRNSPTSSSLGYRGGGDEQDALHGGPTKTKTKYLSLSKVPLYLGIIVCGVILVAVVLAITAPGRLHEIAGIMPVPTNASTLGANETALQYISYENYTTFPLTSSQYRHECAVYTGNFMKPMPYWKSMDMNSSRPMDVKHSDDKDANACLTSITYQLDGTVGLFADLALLAQAAALARERNRTFFVDDAYWNRGKWTDHFEDVHLTQPGFEPGCTRPPPEELVACPRHARHWVINSKTAKYHFSHGFVDEYEDPYGKSLNRLTKIYRHAEESLLQTIRPNAFNARLIRAARSELRDLIIAQSPKSDLRYAGVHIRRGDRKPMSWKFKDTVYVPTANYLSGAASLSQRLDPSRPGSAPAWAYIASDSPLAEQEFISSTKDESYTGPAFKTYSLISSKKEELRALASRKVYVQAEFNEGVGLDGGRVEATRGVIVDFALFSGAWAWMDVGEEEERVRPLGVVCTMSSNMCGLAAAVLHWDEAFGDTGTRGEAEEAKKE